MVKNVIVTLDKLERLGYGQPPSAFHVHTDLIRKLLYIPQPSWLPSSLERGDHNFGKPCVMLCSDYSFASVNLSLIWDEQKRKGRWPFILFSSASVGLKTNLKKMTLNCLPFFLRKPFWSPSAQRPWLVSAWLREEVGVGLGREGPGENS